MRKAIIAGNWKMNKTPEQAKELVSALVPLVKDAECDVVVCTPAVDFAAVSEVIKGTNIKLGAENVHWKESGAFTGELSADMLKACGVEYVIIGHSERRQYFGETDATVNLRVKAALAAGLIPIICVGEKKEEREAAPDAPPDDPPRRDAALPLLGERVRPGDAGDEEKERKDEIVEVEADPRHMLELLRKPVVLMPQRRAQRIEDARHGIHAHDEEHVEAPQDVKRFESFSHVNWQLIIA